MMPNGIVSDCLNYHSEKYPEYKTISCNLIVKTSIIDNSCEYIVGTLNEKEGRKNIINLSINPDC